MPTLNPPVIVRAYNRIVSATKARSKLTVVRWGPSDSFWDSDYWRLEIAFSRRLIVPSDLFSLPPGLVLAACKNYSLEESRFAQRTTCPPGTLRLRKLPQNALPSIIRRR